MLSGFGEDSYFYLLHAKEGVKEVELAKEAIKEVEPTKEAVKQVELEKETIKEVEPAKEAVKNDPDVKSLLDTFDATIDQDSIQPQ